MHGPLLLRHTALLELLKEYGPVLIAFSGGTDSSLLAYTARQTLGKEHVLAVTADAETFPRSELREAEEFAQRYDIPHRIIRTEELRTINEHGNDKDRCYHCKHAIFTSLRSIAEQEGYTAVLEGSNTDDDSDYRPGRRAIQELGIRTPLKDAGLSKQDIRDLSRSFGLPTWDRPAYACLTSRFPYNVTITTAALAQVEQAEDFLHTLGFRQCRVRYDNGTARIEVEQEQLARILKNETEIIGTIRAFGLSAVTIDPEGYRRGSMNAMLSSADRSSREN